MNVLLNFGPLKIGGGQNVALNFLQSLGKLDGHGMNFILILAEGSQLESWVKKHKNWEYVICPSNPLKRMIFELSRGRGIVKKYKVDVIFSYFGIGLYPKSIPQVTGSADSNLFFPEVDFWVEYSGLALLKRKIVDKYRIWGLKRSQGIIFENKMMMKRCGELFGLHNSVFIKPSISLPESQETLELPIALKKADLVGLFLCGWQRNKNFALIPEMAAGLKAQDKNGHFIITAPADNSPDHLAFEATCRKLEVSDRVWIIGRVKKEQLPDLYRQVSFVFLLSKLESFSNNIIEAWYFKRPLVISDSLWAKAICEKAALYVDRDSPEHIISQIEKYLASDELQKALGSETEKMLGTYPTIEERSIQELNYLKHVVENS